MNTRETLDNYELRVTRLIVAPIGQPLFSEQATRVEIADEAAGEFIEITQQSMCADKTQSIAINRKSEWEAIKAAVELLLRECREESE